MSSEEPPAPAAAPSVFLSYPHTEVEAVTRFVDALEGRGFRVWRDAAAIRTGDRYTARIDAGLAGSQALIAWFSRDYPESSYCMYELKAAWLRAQALGGDPLRRIVVANPEGNASHIWAGEVSELQLLPVSRDRPPNEEELAALWERVSALPGTLADAGPPPMPRIRPRHRERYGGFVGHEADLWRMHRALNPHPNEGRPALMQLVGFGGVGKSLLALEYAHVFGSRYPGGIFWLDAHGVRREALGDPAHREERRAEQLAEIAAQLQGGGDGADGAGDPYRLVGERLDALGQRYLWVVDDFPEGLADGAGELSCRWQAPSALGCTLVTTRSRAYTSVGIRLDVEQLDPDAARHLLTHENRPLGDAEEAAAGWLVEHLGCHAMAVDVAGRAIRLEHSYAGYAEMLRRLDFHALGEQAEALATQFPLARDANLAKTILLSVAPLGEAALSLLRLVCMAGAATPVPVPLARALLGRAGGEPVADRAEAGFTGALASLEARSLVRTSRPHGPEPYLAVHSVIAYTMVHGDPAGARAGGERDRLARELEALLLDPAWFRAQPREDEPRAFQDQYDVLERVRTDGSRRVVDVIAESGCAPVETRIELLHLLGATHEELFALDEASRLLRRAAQLAHRAGLAARRAEILTDLGIVTFHQAGHDAARRVLERARRVFEKLDEAERSERYAMCLDWLGEHFREIEAWQQALALHGQAEEVAGRLLGAVEGGDWPCAARRRSLEGIQAHAIANVGAVHYWRRDYALALDCWRKSLQICARHRDRSTAHYQIDVGYMTFLVDRSEEGITTALGHLEEGISLARQNGYREEEARGAMNAGTAHFLQGDFEEAERLYGQALAIGSKKLGWRIRHNLGNLFFRRAHPELAREHYESATREVREILRSGFRKEADYHKALTHRLNVFRSLIVFYRAVGDESAAAEVAAEDPRLAAYLRRRRERVNLAREEAQRHNHNFFILDAMPFYVETE